MDSAAEALCFSERMAAVFVAGGNPGEGMGSEVQVLHQDLQLGL